jgi:hypothetical protein
MNTASRNTKQTKYQINNKQKTNIASKQTTNKKQHRKQQKTVPE